MQGVSPVTTYGFTFEKILELPPVGAGEPAGCNTICHEVSDPAETQPIVAVVPVILAVIKFVGAGHCAETLKKKHKANNKVKM